MKKAIFISFILLIIFLNYTPLTYLLKESYTYSNDDGSFKFQEDGGGGKNFEMAKRRYTWFLEKNPDKAARDNKLYRTFTIKPWRVWQWSDYAFHHERFSLPYKDPQIIENEHE